MIDPAHDLGAVATKIVAEPDRMSRALEAIGTALAAIDDMERRHHAELVRRLENVIRAIDALTTKEAA